MISLEDKITIYNSKNRRVTYGDNTTYRVSMTYFTKF